MENEKLNIANLSDKALIARLAQVRSRISTASAALKEAQSREKELLEEIGHRVEAAENAIETPTKTGGVRREAILNGHTAYITQYVKRDFNRSAFDIDFPGVYETYKTKVTPMKKIDVD